MTKIYIKSCHGSLEYDQARMLTDMGYKVGGHWDIGGTQRPKVPGVTDVNSSVDDYDNVILHQTERFQHVMEDMLKSGKRVILNAFGQGDDGQHKHVSDLCRNYPHAYVCSYSVKDYNKYSSLGCPQEKLELIRFPKYIDDFKTWKGKWPVCYISCNSIHRRGTGCGWDMLRQIESSGIPVILGGSETAVNSDFGIGQIEEPAMRNIYSNVMCHLHLGTVPAPITLTLIEAFCSGTPVVAYRNGHGLEQEGFDLNLHGDVDSLINALKTMLNNPEERQKEHEKSLRNREQFNVRSVANKWRTLIERLLA